jgi:hypothetical protein
MHKINLDLRNINNTEDMQCHFFLFYKSKLKGRMKNSLPVSRCALIFMCQLSSPFYLLTFVTKFIDDTSGKLGFFFPSSRRAKNTELQNFIYIVQYLH